MVIAKQVVYALVLQLVLITPSFSIGLRGLNERRNGFVARRLSEEDPIIQAEAETVSDEILHTFTSHTGGQPQKYHPPVALKEHGEVARKQPGNQETKAASSHLKSKKEKIDSRTIAPKVPKDGTAAPKGSYAPKSKRSDIPHISAPTRSKKKQTVYPGKTPTPKDGKTGSDKGSSKTPKGSASDTEKDKIGHSGSKTTRAPKGIKGAQGSGSRGNNKKEKSDDDGNKAPKGKNGKEKGGKNKIPDFPADDDDHYNENDDEDGASSGGQNSTVSRPPRTMAPTEPKDGRKTDDDDDEYYYYDDETVDDDADENKNDGNTDQKPPVNSSAYTYLNSMWCEMKQKLTQSSYTPFRR